jgi:hypothetical protein
MIRVFSYSNPKDASVVTIAPPVEQIIVLEAGIVEENIIQYKT